MPRKKAVVVESAPVLKRRVHSPAFALSLVGLGVVVAVSAVLLGRSDTGQIDVEAAVRASLEGQTDASGAPLQAPPGTPDALRNLPNGGLVPQGSQSAEAAPAPADPVPDAASTTATSSEEMPASDETVPAEPEAAAPDTASSTPQTETPAPEDAGV